MKVNNAAVLFGDVYFPNATEQSKIVEFLQILDYRIKKQRALVESLKKYKRGLSDKIFSTIVITSNCKKISWKNVFLPLQNNTFSRDDLIQYGGTVRDIHYGDILVKYGATVNLSSVDVPCIKPEKDISKFSINSYLQNGDIVIADTAEDYSVGKATEIIGSNGIMALSGLHTIPCRPCIEFAISYLYENMSEPIDAKSITQDLYISKNILRIQFKSTLDSSYKEILSQFRVRYAEALLTTTNLPIMDIAIESGFGSDRTMTRVFFSINGISPGEFRKQRHLAEQNEKETHK